MPSKKNVVQELIAKLNSAKKKIPSAKKKESKDELDESQEKEEEKSGDSETEGKGKGNEANPAVTEETPSDKGLRPSSEKDPDLTAKEEKESEKACQDLLLQVGKRNGKFDVTCRDGLEKLHSFLIPHHTHPFNGDFVAWSFLGHSRIGFIAFPFALGLGVAGFLLLLLLTFV